ncbi:hypothetical protein AAG747_09720 [Rapidithrix thailandica]|uniref:Membrane dipeptidase (Peptidase family M19) n=1 Tax=Rapidithrix thailandica TaxID=413964 RepID=A0AAW9RTE7_9BACT
MKHFHNDKLDLWKSYPRQGLRGFINSIVRIPAFSQSDFRKLAQANVQVVFCALHPPEQKMSISSMYYAHPASMLRKMVETLAGRITSVAYRKINEYFQSTTYDHYSQLKYEIKQLLKSSEQNDCFSKVKINGTTKRCSYHLVKNATEIHDILEKNKQFPEQLTIAVVLTVEGLHALGRGHINFNGYRNPRNVKDNEILYRLDLVKGVGEAGDPVWNYTPIWVNLTHMFSNSICGHAQGFNLFFRMVLEYAEPFGPLFGQQSRVGLNQGITPLGEKVIKRLLGIDSDSKQRKARNEATGKRILIDIKHMSTQSRMDYYALLDQYQQEHPEDSIPIVMSHAAVNGKKSVYDEPDPVDSEIEYDRSGGFNPWSINLYDDEIVRIHQSKGLIGLIFSERILAGGEKLRYLKNQLRKGDTVQDKGLYAYFRKSRNRFKWTRLILDQIYHIVNTVMQSQNVPGSTKSKVWDIICIGSDFDGQITPIGPYKSVKAFPVFKQTLLEMLCKDTRFEPLKRGFSEEELVDKICFKNAYLFLNRNFK